MIVPYFGEEIVTATSIEVRINPEDRERAQALVERTSEITAVDDAVSFEAARGAAGQIKALLDEIALDKKRSKLPFAAVEAAIEKLAVNIANPVKTEQDRILGLLNGYVTKLEAARKADERARADAQRKVQEEADRRVREAEIAQAAAQSELQAAKDEIERSKLREAAQRRDNQLLQQQLARELAADVEQLGQSNEPPRGLVPGGRVNHTYDFELVNVQATCDARCYRLLRWALDIRACQDSVKTQVEMAPNIEPSLPGIKITKRLNVSVKASSRIT